MVMMIIVDYFDVLLNIILFIIAFLIFFLAAMSHIQKILKLDILRIPLHENDLSFN